MKQSYTCRVLLCVVTIAE